MSSWFSGLCLWFGHCVAFNDTVYFITQNYTKHSNWRPKRARLLKGLKRTSVGLLRCVSQLPLVSRSVDKGGCK